MATVLYTAQVPLKVSSAVATWFCEADQNLPLDPAKASTIALLAAGDIVPAPENAADTCTPPHVLRGQPGIKIAVSN